MGNNNTKSSPDEVLKEIPSRCIYLQGFNDCKQCGRDGYPLSDQQEVITAVAGMHHTLAILKSGNFVSWGSNDLGQLGTEGDSYISSYLYEPTIICPVVFPKEIGTIRIVSISAGVWHSACVTDSGQLLAWGANNDCQLGINPKALGTQTKYDTGDKFLSKPTLVQSLSDQQPLAVYCGSNYTIVRTTDNKVFSFGNGNEGVLGNGNTNITFSPQEIVAFRTIKLKKITCGWNHCLALTTSGKVYYWGNQYKDVVDKSEPSLFPNLVEEITPYYINDIACGDYHSCALSNKDPNILFLWGSNGFGQLGDSTLSATEAYLKPIPLKIEGISQVVCGGLFTVVRLHNGSVLGWGCNRQKQIGEGFGNIVSEPQLIIRKNPYLKRVGAGYSHIFFLSTLPITKDEIINPESEIKRKAFSFDCKSEHSGDHTDDRI
jgi:alpha-tubulin suppressor-like RCC1 family protein